MTIDRPHVLLLSGGPDAERDVSIDGAEQVERALREANWCDLTHETIDRPSLEDIRTMPGEVVFPLLHGQWGEGGPMQDLLEADGRPYVGCGPHAARLAMDKIATKSIAMEVGAYASVSAALRKDDAGCPLEFPVVLKPVHEGSTIGLHICRTPDEWRIARAAALATNRPYMIEPFIAGREMTVGIIDDRALPLIEIVPADGLYDYNAKYKRDDTRYIIGPDLPASLTARLQGESLRLARRIGCAQLARADWLLDANMNPWLLEINTMPGFTPHSLVPMAAKAPEGGGLDLAALCRTLIVGALRGAKVGV